MFFPKDFTTEAQAKVMGAKINAAKALVAGKKRLPKTIGDGQRDKGITALVQPYILHVFAAFAHEACRLGLNNAWTVVTIDSEVINFVRDFVLETLQEHHSENFRIPAMLSSSNGLVLPELWDGFRESDEWRKYQKELLKVAHIQSGKRGSTRRKTVSNPKDREQRLQHFIRSKTTTIAAVRRVAKVAKTNMQDWRHGKLAATSVMSQRIESVLSGKTPLTERARR